MLRKLSSTVRKVGGRFASNDSRSWLESQGLDNATIEGVLRSFDQVPSVFELKSMGTTGLNALVESVKKSSASEFSLAEIKVNINLPQSSANLEIVAKEGETFYELAIRNKELGEYLVCSCNGIAACSTCHVIVDPKYFAMLPEPDVDELDMLDLAYGVADTSRLGCQLKFTKELDGLTVLVPDHFNDLYS